MIPVILAGNTRMHRKLPILDVNVPLCVAAVPGGGVYSCGKQWGITPGAAGWDFLSGRGIDSQLFFLYCILISFMFYTYKIQGDNGYAK
jgi:hypothetical protein